MTSQSSSRVPSEALRLFARRAYLAVGLSEADAATVAGLMAEADLYGADGHGVFRLPQYIRRIKVGGVNKNPNIRVLRETAATALIDGDNGMGHLVMKRAAELAIEKARTAGIGWVGARLSNHAGPALLYARMPMAADMIGLYLAVGNANHLAPWGGIDMLLSTSIDAFGDRTEFKRRVDTVALDIRASKRLPGYDRIWLPGEQSAAKRVDREQNGVPVPPQLLASLRTLADALRIDPLIP